MTGIKFDQVILCGSIVPRDYDWQQLISGGQVKRVLNECAEKDVVVKAAPFFIQDSGSSGAYGFDLKDDRLCQRTITKFGHSDYLHISNFAQTWIPFLEGDPAPRNRPPLNRQSNWKYSASVVVLLLLLLGLIFAAAQITRHFMSPKTTTSSPESAPPTSGVKPETVVLSGSVMDQNARPIQGVEITIDDIPEMRPVETSTDGVFSVNDIPKSYNESVRIRVSKEGYQPNPYTEDVVLGKAPPRIKLLKK